MNDRVLGRTDLKLPPIVFGAMARRDQTDQARVEIIRAAIDKGLTTIDTAPLYDFGNAEREWLAGAGEFGVGNVDVVQI